MNRKYSRRTFGLLLPAAAAGGLQAQDASKRLPSKMFAFADLPTKIGNGTKSHAVLDGQTHTGYPVEVHVTELAAGKGAPSTASTCSRRNDDAPVRPSGRHRERKNPAPYAGFHVLRQFE